MCHDSFEQVLVMLTSSSIGLQYIRNHYSLFSTLHKYCILKGLKIHWRYCDLEKRISSPNFLLNQSESTCPGVNDTCNLSSFLVMIVQVQHTPKSLISDRSPILPWRLLSTCVYLDVSSVTKIILKIPNLFLLSILVQQIHTLSSLTSPLRISKFVWPQGKNFKCIWMKKWSNKQIQTGFEHLF